MDYLNTSHLLWSNRNSLYHLICSRLFRAPQELFKLTWINNFELPTLPLNSLRNLLCKAILSAPQYISTAEPDAVSHLFITAIKRMSVKLLGVTMEKWSQCRLVCIHVIVYLCVFYVFLWATGYWKLNVYSLISQVIVTVVTLPVLKLLLAPIPARRQ